MATKQPGKRGRPVKQPVTKRIQDALGAAQDEIDSKLPASVQNDLVPAVAAPVLIVESSTKITKDAQDDYDFARTNLHSLLMKGNDILSGITDLVQGSDSPRAFEVASGVLKTLIEGTRELMQLQKDIRDVEKKTVGATPDNNTTVNVAHVDTMQTVVLEGTTMEMLDILAAAKKNREDQKLIEEGK